MSVRAMTVYPKARRVKLRGPVEEDRYGRELCSKILTGQDGGLLVRPVQMHSLRRSSVHCVPTGRSDACQKRPARYRRQRHAAPTRNTRVLPYRTGGLVQASFSRVNVGGCGKWTLGLLAESAGIACMASLLLPYVCLPYEEQGRDVVALVSLQYGELVEAMGDHFASGSRSLPVTSFSGICGHGWLRSFILMAVWCSFQGQTRAQEEFLGSQSFPRVVVRSTIMAGEGFRKACNCRTLSMA